MNSHPYAPTKLEQLLHDACRRAVRLDLTFADQLRLFRSVIALAREVRLRFGRLAPQADHRSLAALLATVCDRACDVGLDPTLPLPDALLLQRVSTGLSRAVRLTEGRIGPKKPMQRGNLPESPAEPDRSASPPSEDPPHRAPEKRAEDPTHREDEQNPDPVEVSLPLADPDRPDMVSAEHPIHREPMRLDDDERLSVWRTDHTADRDQRAHERLRTVMDDRVLNKIRAMNRRERDEAAALALASPVAAVLASTAPR
jgi:hypothetical protein